MAWSIVQDIIKLMAPLFTLGYSSPLPSLFGKLHSVTRGELKGCQ
jgi:hypothetical protein